MNKRLFLVVVVGTMFFTACKEKEETPTMGGCPPGMADKNIAAVKMEITAIRLPESSKSYELVSVKYENGSLELNFPTIVSDEYLGSYFWGNSNGFCI